jgi:hypothetical protein
VLLCILTAPKQSRLPTLGSLLCFSIAPCCHSLPITKEGAKTVVESGAYINWKVCSRQQSALSAASASSVI